MYVAARAACRYDAIQIVKDSYMTTQNDVEQLIAPVAAHDDLTFDELSQSYNFQNVSDRVRMFARLVRKELEGRESPVRALDIGCGEGLSVGKDSVNYLRAIHEKTDELWGVEPDPSIEPSHGLFTNFQHALLEDAELPDDYFDVAYSFMVMEHVADPVSFLNKVKKSLKPGGVHIFVTPNGHHYFTKFAGTAKKLKIDEILLKLLRGAETEDYHYPVEYRCNKFQDINRLAKEAGFTKVTIATDELNGPKPYLPGPLRIFWWLMMKKRAMIKNPKLLLNLYARLEK